MCDCVQLPATIANPCSSTRFWKLGFAQCSWISKPVYLPSEMLTGYNDCSITKKLPNCNRIKIFKHEKLFMGERVRSNSGLSGSNAFDLNSELRLKEEWDDHLELDLQNGEANLEELELGFINENEAPDNIKTRDCLKSEKSEINELGMLNFDEPLRDEDKGGVLKPEDLMAIEAHGKNDDSELEDDQVEELLQSKPKTKHKPKRKLESRSIKQLMKRSSILAKQVIGVESARSLGFVSQLWVDTATWAVLEVEVRPNLLSSESVKFHLEDINKAARLCRHRVIREDIFEVGDVVLVQEENCILNEFRTVGLESLVGYSVVTHGQRNLGKVRGYTFSINSGTVESLEIDAFGYSIIPSSLVSTYALFVEDVLEVVPDIIIVHEAAASRIQRLTKGFLGTKNAGTSSINHKNHNLELESMQPIKDRKSKRKSSKRKSKFYQGARDAGNDFELPMDYM